MKNEIRERLNKIQLVVSDCDGVLTDGGLYYAESGMELKKFNVLDGMGFLMLKENGIKTGIITGEKNPLVINRARKLQIDFLILDTKDKYGNLCKICKEIGISISEAVYIGDDVFDVPAIQKCGFGVAPADALSYVREKADYVTEKAGGKGCFREIADLILKAKGINLLEGEEDNDKRCIE